MTNQRFTTLQTDLMDQMKAGWHLYESDISFGTFYRTKSNGVTASVDARVVNGLQAKGMFVRVGNELFLDEDE